MRPELIKFNDCIKDFTVDQDKATSPEKTVSLFYEKIASIGQEILSKVTRVDNGRLGIPVYFSVCGKDACNIIGTKKQMGKGASPEQAKASACMELAERFSFFSYKRDSTNFIESDYLSLIEQEYPVVNLKYLLQSVHDDTLTIDEFVEIIGEIPMQWCWATNISKNEQVLIPFTWFYTINEFNGPSAGNTLEEAAIQGISEVVERHVCSIISQEKITVPEIKKETISDPVCNALINKFKENGIELKLFDFSLDTGMATVAALAWDPETLNKTSEIVITAGTTPGPNKAVIRAITEVAQLAGDFNSNSNYEASGLPKPHKFDDIDYLLRSKKSVNVDQIFDISDKNMRVEIDNCISVLQNKDMDIFMIDISHKELAIPALYTIIPGAHFRERAQEKSAGLFASKIAVNEVTNIEVLDYLLNKVEKIQPDSYYLAFYRGKIMYEAGDLDKAVLLFERSLTLSPNKEDFASICSYYGNALSQLCRYDDAVDVLLKGVEADDERIDIYNILGVCYFKKEMYENAISCFEKAVEIDPSSAMDYANLGVNYSKLGKDQEAIQFLTLALTLEPGLEFAQDLLEKLCLKNNS